MSKTLSINQLEAKNSDRTIYHKRRGAKGKSTKIAIKQLLPELSISEDKYDTSD